MADDEDRKLDELRKLDGDNRARIDRMRSDAAAQSRAGNSPLPWGEITEGPPPSGLKKYITEEGIDRTAYVWADRQRFRTGAGPAKMLFGHDPYAETGPAPDGRANVTFILSTDKNVYELPMGTEVCVRVGREVVSFLTTEPCVVRPVADAVVGARTRVPGAIGNIDINLQAGVTGYPDVRVENPFPGMGGADVLDDGTMMLRRAVRPKLEKKLAGESAPEHESDRTAKDLVKPSLDHIEGAAADSGMPEVGAAIRNWVEKPFWAYDVHIQRFGVQGTDAMLVLGIDRGTAGDVFVALRFKNGRLTRAEFEGQAARKALPR